MCWLLFPNLMDLCGKQLFYYLFIVGVGGVFICMRLLLAGTEAQAFVSEASFEAAFATALSICLLASATAFATRSLPSALGPSVAGAAIKSLLVLWTG